MLCGNVSACRRCKGFLPTRVAQLECKSGVLAVLDTTNNVRSVIRSIESEFICGIGSAVAGRSPALLNSFT